MFKTRLTVAAMVLAGSSIVAGAAPASAFNPQPDPPGRAADGVTSVTGVDVSLGGPDTRIAEGSLGGPDTKLAEVSLGEPDTTIAQVSLDSPTHLKLEAQLVDVDR